MNSKYQNQSNVSVQILEVTSLEITVSVLLYLLCNSTPLGPYLKLNNSYSDVPMMMCGL